MQVSNLVSGVSICSLTASANSLFLLDWKGGRVV